MIRNPFKQRDMARIFDAMIELAEDRGSELYLKDGSPHRGATHRCAYWDGYNSLPRTPHAAPGTLAWACYRAGQAWRKEQGTRVRLERLIDQYEDAMHTGTVDDISAAALRVEREADRIGYNNHARLMALHTMAEITTAEDEALNELVTRGDHGQALQR